jgi:hypothetical protein
MVRRPLVAVFLAVLTVPLVAVSLADGDSPAKPDLVKELIGTWVTVGDAENIIPAPEKGGSLKSFTGRHWNVSLVDPETGIVAQNHGGTYKLDGDTYVETVEYVSPSQKSLLGKTFTFKLKIDGDRLTQTAVDNPFHRAMERKK